MYFCSTDVLFLRIKFNIEFRSSSIRFSINKRVEVLSKYILKYLKHPDDNRDYIGGYRMTTAVKCSNFKEIRRKMLTNSIFSLVKNGCILFVLFLFSWMLCHRDTHDKLSRTRFWMNKWTTLKRTKVSKWKKQRKNWVRKLGNVEYDDDDYAGSFSSKQNNVNVDCNLHWN